ncbi:MAG: radical SAM protein, partial [Candidatus Aegiribacteria sp.]|nr:radical SAM protein [Candidatus Aegiribacteria sp.]
SRSECYGIDCFDRDVLVKTNAVDLLKNSLPRLRIKGTIGTGSMNDPYQPVEKRIGLTRRALEVIAKNHFPVHVITKSDLVVRDMDLLERIGRVYSAVTFTVTTADETLAGKLEPFAPSVTARFKAMRQLSERGIHTGITLMPILPFITDNPANILTILDMAAESGAEYIIPFFGVTLRDRQREHFLREIEKVFPGMNRKYREHFGNMYHCPVSKAGLLEGILREVCGKRSILLEMPFYDPFDTGQLNLF